MAARIQEQVTLSQYTTLQCGGPAEYFSLITSHAELEEAIRFAHKNNLRIVTLGGGSNVLVSDAGVRGLVLHNKIQGIAYEIYDTYVLARVGAGVTLDAFIEETILKSYWGLENLSGIPGMVGAVPIQNVGAYGVEAKDVVEEVYAYNIEKCSFEVLKKEACAFAYRDSFFKTREGNAYIICSVTFRLSLTPLPRITYKDLNALFSKQASPKLQDIRNAVLKIREGKFPDWRKIGTAGSFFKNPIVSEDEYLRLQVAFPLIPAYREKNGVKIPLGWILEHVLNVKGYREGNVGLYEKQALVLINHGGATSDEIKTFAEKIRTRVFNATKISIEFEAVLIE